MSRRPARWLPPARRASTIGPSGWSGRPSISTDTGVTSGPWPTPSGSGCRVRSPTWTRPAGRRMPRLFGTGPRRSEMGRHCSAARRLCVIAGGPGSGKTTAIGRIVALLAEQAAGPGGRLPLVGLVAPTGKAAARLEEAVHGQAPAWTWRRRSGSTSWRPGPRRCTGSSGPGPDSASRFRHHRHHRLPHDVIVVDETSMVPLSLMARLVEAVRPDARLVLVGDPRATGVSRSRGGAG